MTRSRQYDETEQEVFDILSELECDDDDYGRDDYDSPEEDEKELPSWENPRLNGDFTHLLVAISDLPGPQLRAYIDELEYA